MELVELHKRLAELLKLHTQVVMVGMDVLNPWAAKEEVVAVDLHLLMPMEVMEFQRHHQLEVREVTDMEMVVAEQIRMEPLMLWLVRHLVVEVEVVVNLEERQKLEQRGRLS